VWKVARGSLLVLLVAVLGVLFPGTALGVDAGPSGPPAPVTLILFHGEGCPHCAAEREFLTELSAAYPDLVIEQYEVWNDAANRDLLMQTAARLGFDPSGVPVTVIGDEVWIGYADSIGEEITAAVEAGLRASSTAPSPSGAAAVEPPPVNASETVVDVPVLGAVDVSSSSLLVTTLVIGFVDGVNPCSLWVLSLLLAMVLNRGSRGRVLIVGSTFLAVTAAMYALYIFGFYSALDYVGGLSWIRYFVAAIAMTACSS
jgi:glutaredoxin